MSNHSIITTNTNKLESEYFETITQYDQMFDELWIENPYVKKGLACPYFSLFTAEMFMNNNNTDKERHERNIHAAVSSNILLGSNDEMDFKQLISYTDLAENDIGCTLAELIQSGEFKLEELFTSNTNTYCVIFLKNAKFFVVMCNNTGYHIRDCHESVQHTFSDKKQLIEMLNNTYQFNCVVDVGGITYGDYSSIEFIKIEKKFNNTLNDLIVSALDNTEQLTPQYTEEDDDILQSVIAECFGQTDVISQSVVGELLGENGDIDLSDLSDTE